MAVGLCISLYIYFCMAVQIIDWGDSGAYDYSHVGAYGSRYAAGRSGYFSITRVGDTAFTVRSYGGRSHRVDFCEWGGYVLGDCDCYDFWAYGSGFERACKHLWAIKYRFAPRSCF